MTKLDDLRTQLDALDVSDTSPFPYAGCRQLRSADERYATLIPDLDVYLAEMAGYRSSVRRIAAWSDEEVESVVRRLRRSFVERNPVYADLMTKITEVGAGDVRRRLDVAERTRIVLLRFWVSNY